MRCLGYEGEGEYNSRAPRRVNGARFVEQSRGGGAGSEGGTGGFSKGDRVNRLEETSREGEQRQT